MSFLDNMKVGTKLGLGFMAIALFIVVLSVFSILRMNDIASVVHGQNELRTTKLERLYAAREALGQTGIAARNAFIFTDDNDARIELDILDNQKAAFLEALQALTPLFSSSPEFDRMRIGLLAMAEELKRPRAFREAGHMQEFGEFLVKECSPLRRKIVNDIDAVVKSVQQDVDARSLSTEQTLQQSLKIILILSGLSLLMSIIVGVLLTRGLLKQLGGEPSEVSGIAARIASGDLAVTVTTHANDCSSLMYSMKEMRESLARIVSDVRNSTDAIASASTQIASGNLELSARTEHQASSLEQTAASMEELTATVKQNTESAKQANQMALSASNVAVKGGEVVSEVVTMMESINGSAKKIVDIISVIDGIAFQTNILALNAAVEAARAGEQGRGFAVVASEVRTLAQRSAAAAKEIKLLITDSVDKADMGSKLVAQAGSTMNEIVDSVKRVTDIMGEITCASNEQSTGIEQVNQAVGQMDEVTQQNAALVEEAAASAEALKKSATELAEMVAVFKLGGSTRILDGESKSD